MLDKLLKNETLQKLLLEERVNKNDNDYVLIKDSATHKILCYFYKQLCAASTRYEKLSKKDIFREERDVNIDQHNTLKQFSSKYLPHIYLKELLEEKKCIFISFPIGHRVFNMTFYKIHNISKKDFDQLFKSIWMWLYIISAHPQIECVKQLEITIAFLPHKKIFTGINANGNNSAQTFDSLHVNSALTQVCQPINKMLIYRKEECFKVFLHESFHCFGLDFSVQNNDEIHQELHRIFNLDGSIELAAYESYTEFWGEVLNMMFNAFFISGDFDSFSLCFEGIMNVEKHFSQIQVAKILLLTGTTLLDFKNLVQKTHVFEYYILKTMILFNSNSFFEWCIKTNPLFFKIKSNSDFMCFIQDHLNNLHDMVPHELLCKVKDVFYKEKERKKEKREKKKDVKNDKNEELEIMKQTMRMSIVDLV